MAPLFLAMLLILGGCRTKKVPKAPAVLPVESEVVMEELQTDGMNSGYAEEPAGTINGVKIPLDPSVRTGTLSNGMTYYVRKNGKPESIAELRLVVDAGAMQEEEDQLGLAHFVEHMCFNGTENFPKSDLVDYLESIGMRFGAHLNAYTSFDETVYMLRIPTDDQEKFNKGFQILEDWATAVSFEGEEIDKERGVVISEWRTRLGGNYRVAMQTYPKMFYGSRYFTRLPIGTVENLETFKHESLTRYYNDWYRPELMSVVAVGDFDPAEMEEKIKRVFGAIPARSGPEKIDFPIPNHEETLVAIVSDPEATFNTVEIMYKHDSQPINTVDDYKRDLTYDLVSTMLRERLDGIEQQETPPFGNASGYYGQMVRTKDQFSMNAIVADSSLLSGMKALYQEGIRAATFGFNESELARAKSSMMARLERRFRESSKTESRRLAGQYVSNFLTGNAVPGIEATLAMAQELLPAITSQEVNQAMKFFMSPSSRVISISGNESEDHPFPTEEEVMAVLESVNGTELEPYEDNLSDAPLMGDIPTPAVITSMVKQEEIGVTELTFENGVKVVLKPTEFKNDEISMQAFSPGGISLVSDEDFLAANMAVQAVTAGGVAGYDNIQLQKYLSDKTIRLAPYIGDLDEGMQGSCAPKDLEVFLQLMHLYMVAPRPDEAAFNSLISRMSAMYANLLNTPEIFFQIAVPHALYGEHPRRDIAKLFTGMGDIDFDTAEKIYRDRFADAGEFTFVFVGNFDPETIAPMLATYLGTLPSTGRNESFADDKVRAVEGELKKTFEKGSEPKSIVNLVYHGDLEWTGENRYLVQSTVAVLNIMLRENLREDKGGVYGVGIRGNTEKNPVERYSITINFTCDPADVDNLVAACHEEITALQTNGPSAQNMTKVKETQKNSIDEGMQENDYWMSQLVFAYENGADPNRILGQEEKIDALTPDQIQEMAKMLFANSYAEFVLRPEAEEVGDED